MFEALGLSEEAQTVYLALLKSPDANLPNVAKLLGMTEEKVREALDELAKMSLARAPVSDPQLLRPVSPESLTALLAREQAELARRQQKYEERKAAINTLITMHAEMQPNTPGLGVERLEGIDAIRGKLTELAGTCEWEASSFAPGGAQSSESLSASRAVDAEAIDRGVRLRTIYLDSVRNDSATLDYAMWLGELGSEVRTAPTLPLRMVIVDRKIAVVPVDTDRSGAVALAVSGSGLLTALVALFQSVWRTATPLGTGRRRDGEALSPQEEQVLKLLAEGHTDEMIARRLGTSARTARRISSELIARLDAKSRFQAGARAVARGLIDEDDLS
ncbi:LuxR C-terminal-related transcriptional regulator [Catellatospora sichuanensis]|uniref:LuxR C-terminal-related transcriptional regulator n=1 Tax=Catellatospora sichuanensis TaxID=1969805 RepID=UPI001182C90E|nr:LuxR C-terminal-related transcriptional regulator [Catellatospora sichuanensis]